jgi:putative membrane protein
MIKDHTATSAELRQLVSSGKVQVKVPAAMDKAHGAKLDKLNGLSGADFARAYRTMQVSTHKDAVSLFVRYSKGGHNLTLQGFAAKTVPDLREHLRMAEDLAK